MSHSIVLSL